MIVITKALPQLIFYNAMIFTRIGALIMVLPVIGSKLLPLKIKLILCIAITALISFSDVISFQTINLTFGYVILSVIYHMLVGMVYALIIQFIFQSFIMAGNLIAMQMGLGFAQMVDPQNGVSVPAIGQFYMMMVSLLFFVMNGHLYVVSSLFDSFKILPLYVLEYDKIDTFSLASTGSTIFANSLKIALPAVLALLIANITFGIISKASPQINIFSIGFSITLIIGLSFMCFLTNYFIPLFTEVYDSLLQSLPNIVNGK